MERYQGSQRAVSATPSRRQSHGGNALLNLAKLGLGGREVPLDELHLRLDVRDLLEVLCVVHFSKVLQLGILVKGQRKYP